MPKQDQAVIGRPWTDKFGRRRVPTATFTDRDGNVYYGPAAMDTFKRYFVNHYKFFELRGIPEEVHRARPYYLWTTEDPRALREAWLPFISQGQRTFVSRMAKQSDGYVMCRHVPPGIDAPPIAAEIRPLDAVETKPEYYQTRREAQGDERKSAKYVMCPTPLVDDEYEHDHADMRPERRAKHVDRKHGGVDVIGTHPHSIRVKDHSRGQGKRLDMHPHAPPLFENATRAFFVIEGVPKSDSILAQGEAVFNVPSVTLWRAPELPAFTRHYLTGKTVYIVPDGDWHGNWMVITQALLCREFLRGLGLKHVYIAAPPTDEDGQPVDGMKGVDDFLGAGHTVDDLVVIGREMPDTFDEWIAQEAARDRIDGVSRDAEVLQALSLCAGLRETEAGQPVERPGEICKAVGSIAALINRPSRTVRHAMERLRERPGLTGHSHRAISIDGSLETTPPRLRRGHGGSWYRDPIDWDERPIITIAEELRAVPRSRIRVGDLAADLAVDGIAQFVRKDTSIERLAELRAQLVA